MELKVCEKACPIRAAHFAGDRIMLKSPRSLITAGAYFNEPLSVKGAMYQHVCDRSEECENPRNCEDEIMASCTLGQLTYLESAAGNDNYPLQFSLESFMVDLLA